MEATRFIITVAHLDDGTVLILETEGSITLRLIASPFGALPSGSDVPPDDVPPADKTIGFAPSSVAL